MALTFKHILFPTDFSETSKRALHYALEIAHRTKASLHLMHTLEEPYNFAPLLEDYLQRVRRKVETLFEEMLAGIDTKKKYPDLKIKTRIVNGRVAFSILEEAEELKADLIIMGTTGASGISKVLFGTKTTEVILGSKIPILAVPANSKYKGLDHITFLTDYNDGDLDALKRTSDLGKLFDSGMSVMHIEFDRNLKAETTFRGFKEIASTKIKNPDMHFELMIQHSFIAGVADFLETQPTDLLTMVRYKKKFFTNLLNKNHSKELAFYTKLPLLIWIGE